MREYPWGKGTPKWVRDATLNDSDKSFTVPAGKVWEMRFVNAHLTATATVGNRILTVVVGDGANNLAVSQLGQATASQKTQITAYFGMGLSYNATITSRGFTDLSTLNTKQVDDLGPMTLPAGYTIRVYDLAGVDAAADDLTVVLHYVEYDA